LIEILLVALGFFVAWNIGANDTANCIGTAVGGGIVTYRRAVAIVIVFVFLGAVVDGWRNMRTVGQGIILGPAGNPIADPSLPFLAAGILAAAGLWVFMATLLGLPISTSQSMVGAVIGGGIFLSVARPELGTSVNLSRLAGIAASWVLNPIFSAILSLVILVPLRELIGRVRGLVTINRVLGALILISAAYSAYALGANDIGTSMGVVHARMGWSAVAAAVFGASALAVGALTFSSRVVNTVGKGIAPLDPASAFAAQFSAALTVCLFVRMGIPVSTSQALVGGVAGVGMARRASTVNRRNLLRICAAWVATPLIACAVSFLLCRLASVL